jgi:hypothetical protein
MQVGRPFPTFRGTNSDRPTWLLPGTCERVAAGVSYFRGGLGEPCARPQCPYLRAHPPYGPPRRAVVCVSGLSGAPGSAAGVRVRRMMACLGCRAYREARGGGRGWHDLRTQPHRATAAGQADRGVPATGGVRARPVVGVPPAVLDRPAIAATPAAPATSVIAVSPAALESPVVAGIRASLVSSEVSVSRGTPATAVVPVSLASRLSQNAAAVPMPPGPGSSTNCATAAG